MQVRVVRCGNSENSAVWHGLISIVNCWFKGWDEMMIGIRWLECSFLIPTSTLRVYLFIGLLHNIWFLRYMLCLVKMMEDRNYSTSSSLFWFYWTSKSTMFFILGRWKYVPFLQFSFLFFIFCGYFYGLFFSYWWHFYLWLLVS